MAQAEDVDVGGEVVDGEEAVGEDEVGGGHGGVGWRGQGRRRQRRALRPVELVAEVADPAADEGGLDVRGHGEKERERQRLEQGEQVRLRGQRHGEAVRARGDDVCVDAGGRRGMQPRRAALDGVLQRHTKKNRPHKGEGGVVRVMRLLKGQRDAGGAGRTDLAGPSLPPR